MDAGLQEVGEEALRAKGLPAAFVAMDTASGAILGMGSYPTYDPSFYTRPHTKAEYEAFGDRSGDPLPPGGGTLAGWGRRVAHPSRRSATGTTAHPTAAPAIIQFPVS